MLAITIEMDGADLDVGFIKKQETTMAKSFRLALTLASLLGAAPLLAACHTTAGVGQDLSQGGHALTNSANANAPSNPSP